MQSSRSNNNNNNSNIQQAYPHYQHATTTQTAAATIIIIITTIIIKHTHTNTHINLMKLCCCCCCCCLVTWDLDNALMTRTICWVSSTLSSDFYERKSVSYSQDCLQVYQPNIQSTLINESHLVFRVASVCQQLILSYND